MSSTAVVRATTQDNRITNIRGWLEKAKPRIMTALPRHMDAGKVINIALTACSTSSKLAECDPVSIVRSVVLASQLGLEPSGALGSAYLVPYRDKGGRYQAQLIPGYRGLIDLAIRSGKVSRVEAHVVYDCDTFDFGLGTASFIKHKPELDRPDGSKVVATYAVAYMKDGGFQFQILSEAEIAKIRHASKAAGNGPWVDWPDEMRKKSAVRRLAKYLPLSPELAQALTVEDRAEDGIDQCADIIDVLPEDIDPDAGPASSADEIKAKLAAAQPQQAALAEPGSSG